MKIRAYILCGALAAVTCLSAAEQTLTEQFQQALFEEEANRDLDAAIAGYEAVIKRLDEQRDLAATAVFRIGESYRKLGNTNEAVKAYQRILKEFEDQEVLVGISRQNLSVLNPGGLNQRSAPSDSVFSESGRFFLGNQSTFRPEGTPVSSIEQERMELRAFLDTVKSLDDGSREQLVAIQTYRFNERLAQLLAEMDSVELKITELQQQLGSEHPSIKSAVARFEEVAMESEEQRRAILLATEKRYKTLEQILERDRAEREKGAGSNGGVEERRKLYQEELALLEQQVSMAEEQYKAGVLSQDDLIKLQREELQLKRELAAVGSSLSNEPSTPEQALLNQMLQRRDYFVTRLTNLRAQFTDNNPQVVSAQKQLDQVQEEIARLEQQSDPSGKIRMTTEEAEELRRVQALVANSPDLLDRRSGDPSRTPLQNAAAHGWVNITEFLLKNGVEMDREGDNGQTALNTAAKSGHLAIVNLLIQNGADLDKPDSWGRTPLFNAIDARNTAVAKVLIAAGADLNQPETQGHMSSSPLERADLELSKILLSKGALPDGAPGSNPPIVTAGHWPEKMEMLLKYGADPKRTNSRGESALYVAASSGYVTNVIRLLELGLNPTVQNSRGQSALGNVVSLLATENLTAEYQERHMQILDLLLDAGANPNSTFNEAAGSKVVHLAAGGTAAAATDALRLLVEHGGDVSAHATDGHTPLHQAALIDRVGGIELLLENGADVNVVDQYGDTPLHFAVMNKSVEAAKTLLEAGADSARTNSVRLKAADYIGWKASFQNDVPVVISMGGSSEENMVGRFPNVNRARPVTPRNTFQRRQNPSANTMEEKKSQLAKLLLE